MSTIVHRGRWATLLMGLALLLLAGCRPPLITPRTPTVPAPPTDALGASTEQQPPDAVLTAFYVWYSGFPGNMLAQRTYREHPVMQQYIADPFFDEVDALLDSFLEQPAGGYDPFICAQDRPTDYEVRVLSASSDEALLAVGRGFNGGAMTSIEVTMQQIDGSWKIADVDCSLPAETAPPPTPPLPAHTIAAPQVWARYHNETYGFGLEYPAGWSPVETPVIDPHDADPVDGYVIFVKEGNLQPIALVISSGPLAHFRLMFPQPEESSEHLLHGYLVWTEQHFGDEAYTIIEHPQSDMLRVAIRVIQRNAPAAGDLGVIAAHMLESFSYDAQAQDPS